MGSHVPSLPLRSVKAEMREEWPLVCAVQVDSPGAFREFVESFQTPIYSLLLALLGDPAVADALAQNVFVEAHRSIRQFRSQESALARLFGIAVRMAMADAGRETQDLSRGRAIKWLRKLSDDERVLLVLREVHGYSVPELSELFRVEEVSVRDSLLKARKQLVQANLVEKA